MNSDSDAMLLVVRYVDFWMIHWVVRGQSVDHFRIGWN